MQSASFGLVIADSPVVFDTQMVQQPCGDEASASYGGGSGVVARWSHAHPCATVPSSVWLFLTGNAPLPAGKALSVYIADGASPATASAFLFLGFVTAERPSGKFVVPCGLSRAQFSGATAVGAAVGASTSSGAGVLLGFCLEDEASAAHQSAAVAAPSQGAHVAFVMRVAGAVTASMRATVEQCGQWLQGQDPNGSDSTIVVDPKAIDRCKIALDKQVGHSISQFA